MKAKNQNPKRVGIDDKKFRTIINNRSAYQSHSGNWH